MTRRLIIYGLLLVLLSTISVAAADTTPPSLAITDAPLRYSNQVFGQITFSVDEPATFQCSLDAAAYVACTSPFNYDELANGDHTLTVKATDSVGNVSAPLTYRWTVNTFLAASSALLLPQTGQTKCGSCEVVSCGGTGSFCMMCRPVDCVDGSGDDGDIRAGVPWPDPRFTDNGNGIVTDNLTGLLWAKDLNLLKTRNPEFDNDVYNSEYISSVPGDGLVTWQHALDYIKKLNTENYLGRNDWRLPNVVELNSIDPSGLISNYSDEKICRNFYSTFINSNYNYYWSSTTYQYPSYTYKAFVVVGGNITVNDKNMNRAVWPVSGDLDNGSVYLRKTMQSNCYDESGILIDCNSTGQDAEIKYGVELKENRFDYSQYNIIIDHLTGLFWPSISNIPGSEVCSPGVGKEWSETKAYIDCLNSINYLNYNDWRVANIIETTSIGNYSFGYVYDWLAQNGFTGYGYGGWSSSNNGLSMKWTGINTTGGWDIYGFVAPVSTVRGGYIQQKLNLTIAGTGAGTITSNVGNITWVGNIGKTRINPGEVVTLTATPDGISTFAGWSGACSGLDDCQLTVNGPLEVTATFFTDPFTAATMLTPANEAVLTGASATFSWSDAGASLYQIHVGTSPGGSDLGMFPAAGTTATTATIDTLPVDGRTLYVRLWSLFGATWSFNDYTYTAAGSPAAAMITPGNGTVLPGATQDFTWSDAGASLYQIHLGTTPGGSDLGMVPAAGTTATTTTLSGLPVDGSTIYVRLWSLFGATWSFNDYTYTAAGTSPTAAMVAPAGGTVLAGASQDFTWSDSGASLYQLHLGTAPGGSDLGMFPAAGTTATATTVDGLPVNGSTIYVRLWSLNGATWTFNDYSYTAAGIATAATMITPTSTISGASQDFAWSNTGANLYQIHLGTSPGGSDLGMFPAAGTTATTTTVTGQPTTGTIHVRLWSLFGSTWLFNDYSYTAEP